MSKGEDVKKFLIGDTACAQAGQKPPEGFYNIQMMLGRVQRPGRRVQRADKVIVL